LRWRFSLNPGFLEAPALVTPLKLGLQVKNRMDPAFDSARTAGYRDVVVNLQLVSEDAELIGVARHICELQLILVPVFERKVQHYLRGSSVCSKKLGTEQILCTIMSCVKCGPMTSPLCFRYAPQTQVFLCILNKLGASWCTYFNGLWLSEPAI
jgi:hypothetical protein